MYVIFLQKIKSFFYKENKSILIGLISLLFFLLVFIIDFFVFNNLGEQQFIYLADSFLHGKTYFLSLPGRWMDTTFFNGQFYWPLGPFPALLSIPFLSVFNVFNLDLSQALPNFLFSVLVFILIIKITSKIGYLKEDSLYLAFAFCFGSVLFAAILLPWSWWFSHTITVLFVLSAIWEFFTKKRYWLIGIFFGFIFLTRATAAIGVLFFIFDIILSSVSLREKRKQISELIFPVCLSVILFFLYNLVRFNNILDPGYSGQILIPSLVNARLYGLFNIVHIPGNLYYFLFSGPIPVLKNASSFVLKFPYLRPNEIGMSIFITSPYFLYFFSIPFKNKKVKLLLLTSFFIALAVFSYYGIGYFQYGYRYSLDFLPFLFLALVIGYREKFNKLSTSLKVVIIASALFNLFLILNMLRLIYNFF